MDGSRARAARLAAVLAIQRRLDGPDPMDDKLVSIARELRGALRARRLALLIGPDVRTAQLASVPTGDARRSRVGGGLRARHRPAREQRGSGGGPPRAGERAGRPDAGARPRGAARLGRGRGRGDGGRVAGGAVARHARRGRRAGAARGSGGGERAPHPSPAPLRRGARGEGIGRDRATPRAGPGQDRVPLGGLARAAHAADRAAGLQRAAAALGVVAGARPAVASSTSTPRRARWDASSGSCWTCPGSRPGARSSSSRSWSISPG